MPLDLDVVTEVINVHWAGVGDFAIGGTARDTTKEGPIGVFYSSQKDESTDQAVEWNSTHIDPDTPAPPTAVHDPAPIPRETGLRFNYLNAMTGGKLKEKDDKGVIVAGGFRSDITSVVIGPSGNPGDYTYYSHSRPILFFSDDGGQSWTKAICPVTTVPGSLGTSEQSGLRYLAFDPEARTFYGDVDKQTAHLEGAIVHRTYERHLISSKNGKDWIIADSVINDANLSAEFTSPFLRKIPGIPNNGFTEVINTDADPPVKLTYTTKVVVPDIFGGGIKLAPPWKIQSDEGSTTVEGVPYGEVTAAGTTPNKGFAYSKGRFLIAGSLMLTNDDTKWQVLAYISDDDGKTWKKTLEDNTTFITSDPYASGGIGCAGSPGCAGA